MCLNRFESSPGRSGEGVIRKATRLEEEASNGSEEWEASSRITPRDSLM
jgi:hypothetical protein